MDKTVSTAAPSPAGLSADFKEIWFGSHESAIAFLDKFWDRTRGIRCVDHYSSSPWEKEGWYVQFTKPDRLSTTDALRYAEERDRGIPIAPAKY